jgi:hypothetical protein
VLAGVVPAEQEVVAVREESPYVRRGAAAVATVLPGEAGYRVGGEHVGRSAAHIATDGAARAGGLVAGVIPHDQYAARRRGDSATRGGTERGMVTVAEGGAGVLIVELSSARRRLRQKKGSGT